MRVSRDLDLQGGTAGTIEFMINGSGKGHFWLRNLKITQLGAEGETALRDYPLYDVNFKSMKLFRVKYDNHPEPVKHREFDGQTIPGSITVMQFRAGASGEISIEDIAGVRALGMRNVGASHGVQLACAAGEAISLAKPGEVLRLRVVYRYDGNGYGGASFQLTREPYSSFHKQSLPPTQGEWKTIDIDIARPDDSEKYGIVIHAPTTKDNMPPVEGTLYIASIEFVYANAKAP